MRKIEMQVIEAIKAKKNGDFGATEIVVSDVGNVQVILHGSPIIRTEKGGKDVYASLAGFNTNVTRSRINAAFDAFGISRIGNRAKVPYVLDVEVPVTGWFCVMRDGIEISATPVK